MASPTLLAVDPRKNGLGDGVILEGFEEGKIKVEEPMGLDEEDEDVVVAFCGSVMEKYFNFRERCQVILDELVSYPPLSNAVESLANGVNRSNGVQEENEAVTGTGRLVEGAGKMKGERRTIEQRRVILEENTDGGILGAGILAAVMDSTPRSSA